MKPDASLARTAAGAADAWRRAGLERRLRILQEVGRRLSGERAALIEVLRADGFSDAMAEEGLAWITYPADADLLEGYARLLIRRVKGDLLVRRPDGVVLLIPPANAPTVNAAAMFPMLLPGNALIVRAPENDRGIRFLAQTVRAALRDHGLPEEVVQVVTCRSRELLSVLLPAPEIKTVVFFGNSEAGRSVSEQALRVGKKVVFELEGSDRMVLWADAPLERAVRSAARSFHASSQQCMLAKVFLAHGRVAPPFLSALAARARALTTVEADPIHGLLIPLARPEAFDAALEEVRGLGEVHTGGHRMGPDGRPDPRGRYAAPTLVSLSAEVCLNRPLLCLDEEIFFPLWPVVRFEGTDDDIRTQMIDLVRRSPFGLRASLWSETSEVIASFAAEIGQVGLLVVNDDHAHVPAFASPWGGVGRSGGPNGESHFFWEKTSHLQAITCRTLSEAQVTAILDALGARSLVE